MAIKLPDYKMVAKGLTFKKELLQTKAQNNKILFKLVYSLKWHKN